MAIAHRILQISDSRGVGIGDPSSYDYMAMPNGTNFGASYTTIAATISGGIGTGAVAGADVYRNADGTPNANQAGIVGITARGKGFSSGSASPTIAVTGNGNSASFTIVFGGGWLVPLETGLKAANLLSTIVPAAKASIRIGAMYGGSPTPGVEWEQALIGVNATNNFVVNADIGINDWIAGETSTAWQTELTNFCTFWLGKGATAIIVDKSFGVLSAYANSTAINALASACASVVDTVAASNPTKIFAGANLYTLMNGQTGYFSGDNVHPNLAGNTAIANAKISAHTSILTSLFGTTTALPGAPTITSAIPGNGQVTLSWTPGTGTTTSYNVKRSLTVGGTYTNLSAGTGVTGTTFTDTTPTNGTSYFYEVSGVNSGGEGVVSAVSSGITPISVVGPPVSLNAVYVAGQGITLTWTNTTTYSGINIYRLSLGSKNGVPQRVDPTPFNYLSGNATSFTDYLVGTGIANISGSNSHVYFITGIINGVETAPSAVIGPIAFTG